MKKYLFPMGLMFLASPAVGLAQVSAPRDEVGEFGDLVCIFDRGINWIFSILIILAVVFVLVGAYKYLFAAGESEKVKSANKTLMYAAIAIAVALLAWSVPAIVKVILNIDEDIVANCGNGGGPGGGGPPYEDCTQTGTCEE